jgi:hypothetical protein
MEAGCGTKKHRANAKTRRTTTASRRATANMPPVQIDKSLQRRNALPNKRRGNPTMAMQKLWIPLQRFKSGKKLQPDKHVEICSESSEADFKFAKRINF